MLSECRVNLKVPSLQENNAFSGLPLLKLIKKKKILKNPALKKSALTGEKKYDVLLLLLHTYVVLHKKCNKM